MGKEQGQVINMGTIEFTQEVPTQYEAEKTANNAVENRAKLIARSDDFGLDATFLARQREFVVAPFVSPAPLPTTFGGKVENLAASIQAGQNIAQAIEQNGYQAKQSVIALLAMTEVPTKGSDAMDILILPKNQAENKRAPLLDKISRGTVYGFAPTSNETLKKAKDATSASFTTYLDLKGVPKSEKRDKKYILDALLEDIDSATIKAQEAGLPSEGKMYYFAFANALNANMLKRITPDMELSVTYVDQGLYDPFLRYGIADIKTFTQKLASIGFFQDDPGFVKVVDKGNSRVFKLAAIEGDDIILACRDTRQQYRFSDLQKSNTLLAPCKELSYVLTQGSFVPAVYGSINTGYYEPYAVAKKRVTALGLSPVFYRVQPLTEEGYNQVDTIFDFYENAMRKETPNEK